MSITTWLPQQPQRQDSLDAQLDDLHRVAARLGMYDAADWLWKARTGQREARSGVPVGGGEPQPTTSTDNERPGADCDQPAGHQESPDPQTFVLARDRVEQVGPLTVRTAPDGSKHVVASKQVTVRSAGGGDQPDTPCPQCGGKGEVISDPYELRSWVPCPACADKETPHGQ